MRVITRKHEVQPNNVPGVERVYVYGQPVFCDHLLLVTVGSHC